MEEIELIALQDKFSPVVEAYRGIRTNLLFAAAGKKIKYISFTSATPGEGKSTTVANIAVVMAQSNKKVLLIDCDMRKPTAHKRFKLLNRGLSNYIANADTLETVVHESVCPNLDVITSGPIPPNPSELLGSEVMNKLLLAVGPKYDYIFLDMPPILAVTDAAVLGDIVDGTVMVIASGDVSPREAVEAKKRLEQSGVPILGVVLNKVCDSTTRTGYYYYYYDEDHNH